MESRGDMQTEDEDTCAAGFPERFEVYSLPSHKAAGLGGIFLFSAIGLAMIGFICFAVYSAVGRDWSIIILWFLGVLQTLPIIPALAELIVELYRFNLSGKIVIEKDRLTVGGRSWDVQSLVECVEIAVNAGIRVSAFHEYAVCDNKGKMIAFFDDNHRNSEQLKRWLQEGGCKLTCRDSRQMFFCHIRKKY